MGTLTLKKWKKGLLGVLDYTSVDVGGGGLVIGRKAGTLFSSQVPRRETAHCVMLEHVYEEAVLRCVFLLCWQKGLQARGSKLLRT